MTKRVTCYKEKGFPLLPEITIKNEQNQVVVRKVPEGGQFSANGVKEGDIILSVNGTSFKGFDNNKVFTTLSVITGEVHIVFGSPGVGEGSQEQSEDVNIELINTRKTRSNSKVKKEDKVETAKPPNKINRKGMKSILQDKNTTMTLKAKDTPKDKEMAVNALENILDQSSNRRKMRTYNKQKYKQQNEITSEQPKVEPIVNDDDNVVDESINTMEECPECDETFSGIEPLSEHYKKAHTVENDDDDVQEISSVPLVVDMKEEEDYTSAEVASNDEHFVDSKISKSLVVETLKKELNSVSDKLSLTEKESINKSEQISKLNEGMELIKERFNDLKRERIEMKKKSEMSKDLETSLKSLKDEVDTKYKEMFDLKRVVLKKEEDLDVERRASIKEKDRNKVLMEEIKKLKRSLTELNKRQKEVNFSLSQHGNSSEELKSKDIKIRALEKDNKVFEIKVNKLTSENESLVEDTLNEFNEEKETLQNKIDEKVVEVEELKSEKSLSKMKIRELEKQMDIFKANAEDITAKISSMNYERENDRNDLVSTIEAQKKKIDELVAEKDHHKERGGKYKRDVTKLLEKISKKEDNIDELQKKCKELDGEEGSKKEIVGKKIKSYQDTILQKSGIITKLEDENQKLLMEKIENLPLVEEKKKCRQLEEQLRKVERQNRELGEKFRVIEIENENKKIQNRIEYTQDVIKTNELSNKLETLTSESIERENLVSKLTVNNEKLEKALKDSTMEAEEKNLLDLLKSEVRTMEATNEKNVEKIISLEIQIESHKNGNSNKDALKNQSRVSELEKDNSELQIRYKVLDDENREHLNDLSDHLKSLCRVKDKYAKLKSKNKSIEGELSTIVKENTTLKDEVRHMSQLQVEVKTLKLELEDNSDKSSLRISKHERSGSASDTSDEENGLYIAESNTPNNKSKWEHSSDEEGNKGFFIREQKAVLRKEEKKDNSADENEFDSSKFIEKCKEEKVKKEVVTDDDNYSNVSDDGDLYTKKEPKIKKEHRTGDLTKAERVAIKNELEAAKSAEKTLRKKLGDELVDKFSLERNNSSSSIRDGKRKLEDRKRDDSRDKSSNKKRSCKEDNRDIDIRDRRHNRNNYENKRNSAEKNRNERFGERRERDQDNRRSLPNNDRDVRNASSGTWSNDPKKRRREERSRQSSNRDSSAESLERGNSVESEKRTVSVLVDKHPRDQKVKNQFPTAVIPFARMSRFDANNKKTRFNRSKDLREQILSYKEFHNKNKSQLEDSKEEKDDGEESNMDGASTSKVNPRQILKKTRDTSEERQKTAKILADVQAQITLARNSVTKFEERNVEMAEHGMGEADSNKTEPQDEKDKPIYSDLEEGELDTESDDTNFKKKSKLLSQVFRKPSVPLFRPSKTSVLSNVRSFGRSA